LSQNTRVTDGQNYDFQDRASIDARAVIKQLTKTLICNTQMYGTGNTCRMRKAVLV